MFNENIETASWVDNFHVYVQFYTFHYGYFMLTYFRNISGPQQFDVGHFNVEVNTDAIKKNYRKHRKFQGVMERFQ